MNLYFDLAMKLEFLKKKFLPRNFDFIIIILSKILFSLLNNDELIWNKLMKANNDVFFKKRRTIILKSISSKCKYQQFFIKKIVIIFGKHFGKMR